jgi:hypothetical protein
MSIHIHLSISLCYKTTGWISRKLYNVQYWHMCHCQYVNMSIYIHLSLSLCYKTTGRISQKLYNVLYILRFDERTWIMYRCGENSETLLILKGYKCYLYLIANFGIFRPRYVYIYIFHALDKSVGVIPYLIYTHFLVFLFLKLCSSKLLAQCAII